MCQDTVGGVKCGSDFYETKSMQAECEEGKVLVCTNACELSNLQGEENIVCPSHCEDFCVAEEIAEKLK